VLVLILHSVDFTFKPFEFATNILAKGLKYRNVSNVSYFKFLVAKKNLSDQTGYLSGQNLSLA